MFAVSEYVIYGTNGVCQVDAIIPSPFSSDDDRLFYALRPVHDIGDSMIYTPVENGKVSMRPLIGKDEAEALLRQIDSIGLLEVRQEKERRDIYKAVLAGQDPKSYLSLLRTVCQRRADCVVGHKRLPDMDNEYESRARKCLCCELSIVLAWSYEKSEAFLRKAIEVSQSGSQ